MPTTGIRDLVANRWEPFVHSIRFEGQDLSAATFAAQVRLYRDAAGAPLISLTNVLDADVQGLAVVLVANEDVDFGAGVGVLNVPVTTVFMRIDEATMEALPAGAPLGDDLTLYWDLQVTPSGGDKYRALEGKFTVHAGVTH